MEMQDYASFDNIFEQKRKAVLFQVQLAMQEVVKEMIDTELDLFEFELFNSVATSKEQSEKTVDEVRKIRKQRWQEALEKNNGDREKALQCF